MDITNHITTFSRMIVFVVITLITSSSRVCCEESQFNTYEELTETQYKNHINEFQRSFGKQMESEFNLKWVEGGFVHNFSNDQPEFYAYRRATLEEVRTLVLVLTHKLSLAIREDPIMLSYLNKLSLTPDTMGVNIQFVYLHNWSYDDGSIDSVYSYHSKEGTSTVKKLYFQYTSTDPFGDFSTHDNSVYTRIEESFEDATKLHAAIAITNPAIHQTAGFEDELIQILASFEAEMKKKYGLRFRSSGWMVAGKPTPNILEIRTKCTYLHSADNREARELILLVAEDLLNTLNDSEALRPYLEEYPFPARRLKLRMLFRKEKYFVGDVPYYDESMESAVLSDDIITYYHHIPNAKDSNMHDRVVYAQESYQEAQKTFENTPPPTLFKKTTKGIKNFISSTIHFLDLAVIVFFMFLLLMVTTGGWLLIIPVVIFFILRRRRSPSQED